MEQLEQEAIKRRIGEAAVDLIQDGMLIGLGTGTTITYFIESLIKRCQAGLKITAVATSTRSMMQAQQGGIPIDVSNQITELDLTIDGADEIDPKNCMIKGGGGALTREKILASSSKKMLVIVDESKLVSILGKFGVAVEIVPFCFRTTILKIERAGFEGKMRQKSDGSLFKTDNGNYIYDIKKPQSFPNPEAAHNLLAALPGVVETGFFFNLPVQALVGYKDGNVIFRN